MDGLERMATRLNYRGGQVQQDRMIQDKKKVLDKAILYSYQGAKVREEGSETSFGALMNPNKVNPNYDEKTISISYDSGFGLGTIFEWENTNTKWIIYLQDLTELSYFHGDVRRCNYQISWKDENGEIQTTYAAVKGPVEKSLNTIYKSNNVIDIPNYTLDLLLPNNEKTKKYFDRYTEFFLIFENKTIPTCWRVEARDIVSTPGIIEIYASEHYYNEFEDDIQNGVVEGLIASPIVAVSNIIGEDSIKPKCEYDYIYNGNEENSWEYDKTLPLKVVIDGKKITLQWLKTYSGEFQLRYGESTKDIVVESLF